MEESQASAAVTGAWLGGPPRRGEVAGSEGRLVGAENMRCIPLYIHI